MPGVNWPEIRTLNAQDRQALRDGASQRRAHRRVRPALGSGLMWLLTGSMEIALLSADGRSIRVSRIREGNVVFLSTEDSDEEMALEPLSACQLAWIEETALKELMMNRPRLGLWVYDSQAAQQRMLLRLTRSVAFASLRGRTAMALLQEEALRGTDELPVSHEELARTAGSTREVVSRMLARMQREGVLTRARRKIVLLDTARLKQWAEED